MTVGLHEVQERALELGLPLMGTMAREALELNM